MKNISVGIIYKHRFAPARSEAEKLEKWLRERGVTVYAEEMSHDNSMDCCFWKNSMILAEEVKCVVVLGGDGTLLGATRQVASAGIPILGVNLGGLGFLTAIPLQRMYSYMELLLEDGLEKEQRLMIETKVLRNDVEICNFQTLNDVVINKGALARIIDLDVFINDEFLTTFRSDGLIISTPTGSTGYNLAAGGPILYPTMSNVILTPISPFTLSNRPIILPDSVVISIMMVKESEEKVNLTFDGQVGFHLMHGDRVLISKSDIRISLFKSVDQGYFEILRKKLKWGGGTLDREYGNS